MPYSMKPESREGLAPTKQEMQAVYSAPRTSYTARDRLKTDKQTSNQTDLEVLMRACKGDFSPVCGTGFTHWQFLKKS